MWYRGSETCDSYPMEENFAHGSSSLDVSRSYLSFFYQWKANHLCKEGRHLWNLGLHALVWSILWECNRCVFEDISNDIEDIWFSFFGVLGCEQNLVPTLDFTSFCKQCLPFSLLKILAPDLSLCHLMNSFSID